jgi:hypothetical protein
VGCCATPHGTCAGRLPRSGALSTLAAKLQSCSITRTPGALHRLRAVYCLSFRPRLIAVEQAETALRWPHHGPGPSGLTVRLLKISWSSLCALELFFRPYCRHRALFPMVGVRSALPALCSCLTIRSFAGSSSCSCGLAHHNFSTRGDRGTGTSTSPTHFPPILLYILTHYPMSLLTPRLIFAYSAVDSAHLIS